MDENAIKVENDDDIMKFINIGDESGSDFELSEDGGSSVASSADLRFEVPGNFELDTDNYGYNWMSLNSAPDSFSEHLNMGIPRTPATNHVQPSPNFQIFGGTNNIQNSIGAAQSEYTSQGISTHAQDLLQRIRFGAFENPSYPLNPPEPESDLLDFDEYENSKLLYSLKVDEFPVRSRVETQIKCRITIRHNVTNEMPPESLLHLPSDTIARPRFQLMDIGQLKNDKNLADQTLWLSVEAINPDLPREQILMCSKCLARERRRAFRKKAMDPHEETYWNGLNSRRIIILNCREVVPINSDGQVDLPLRIACYCRHHAAKNGYQLVFLLRNTKGELVGRSISTKVFITDSHKDQRRVSSTQNLISPSGSNPATPSSVSSSQDSFPTDIHRVSSASSLNMKAPSQQAAGSHIQHAPLNQQQHHPYSRPPKPSAHSSQSSAMFPNGGAGFQQLPSSQLTRQLQKLHSVPSWLAGVQLNDAPQTSGSHVQQQLLQQQQQQQQQQQHASIPTVLRVIPSSGSVRGGIEVTLLGQNFHSGLVAMFGDAQSTNTQCWSDNTIIVQLPPSGQTGPVPVTFLGETMSNSSPTFTYINDGEDKLKELALQMVGYKVTGKIEDAADIAQRIISHDSTRDQGGSGNGNNSGNNVDGGNDIGDSAEQLSLWVLHNMNKISPDRLGNVNLRNSEGQSMIHLASMLGYATVVKALIANGAYIDIQDVSGYTPLHFAVLWGNRNITRLLMTADADPFHRTLNGLTALDLADFTVTDLLPKDQRAWYNELNRRGSSSSIVSMIQEWQQENAAASLLTPNHTSSNASENNDADIPFDDTNLRKPPSYSKLFPSENSQNASVIDVEDDALFPNMTGSASHTGTLQNPLSPSLKSQSSAELHRRREIHVPVIDIEISNSEAEDEVDVDADAEVEETHRDEYLESLSIQEKVRRWTSRNQEIWNDKMLFTFWIPLSLVTVLGILAIYIIQGYGSDDDANRLATKVGDLVANCCSMVIDRIMPMSRWNIQMPVHAMRPAS